jgi:hypothetical protein
VGDELTADFGGTQARIQARRAARWIALTLAIDERSDILEAMGQVVFSALTAARGEGIETNEATFQLRRAFAKRAAVPAQCAFCPPLAARPQLFDRARHKEPTGASFETSGGVDEYSLERVGQCHCRPSSR